jgi:hypothetical protein
MTAELPMAIPDIIRAPFTSDQVKSLNEFQRLGGLAGFHEFTCRSDKHDARDDDDWTPREVLIAYESGWECPDCGLTQDWAHAGMADWSWARARSGSA